MVTTYQSFALRFNLVTHAQVSCSSDRLTRGWLLLDRQNTPGFSLGARMRAIKIVPTSTMHCNVVTCFQSEPRNSFQTCKTFSHISLLWLDNVDCSSPYFLNCRASFPHSMSLAAAVQNRNQEQHFITSKVAQRPSFTN